MVAAQTFADEAAWLAARLDTLGASEVPALFDVGFSTREKLIAEKASGIHRKPDRRQRMRFALGKLLEPVIGTVWAVETGRAPIPCGLTIYRNPAFPWIHATPDFWIIEGEELLEAKSTGPGGLSKWGDWSAFGGRWKWNDEPPVDVVLQVQAQLAVTGATRGHIACLAGTEFHRWPVARDEELIAAIAEESERATREINEKREALKESA